MKVSFKLENNDLIIIFNKEIKSIIKIQLITVSGFKNKLPHHNSYTKPFNIKDALVIKEYLENNNFEITTATDL